MDYLEIEAKTVDDAITDALIQLGVTSDQIEYEVVEKGTTGFLGFNNKMAKIRVRKKFSPEDEIRTFLSQVYDAMGLTVEILITPDAEEENVYNVEMKGDEMGVLIGKRGQTLDALQYLTNLAVNRRLDTCIKVKLDTEDYRRRRKETLENLAKNVAYKVKRTRKAVELEPMNPYERRVIHFALQNDRYVTTHSEGEGAARHVVIAPSEDAPEYRDSRSSKGSRGYKGQKGQKGSKKYNDHKDNESYGGRKAPEDFAQTGDLTEPGDSAESINE